MALTTPWPRDAYNASGHVPFLKLNLIPLDCDTDLPLGKVEWRCDLYPSRSAEVLVEVELLLKLQQLSVCVGGPKSSRKSILCNQK